MGREEGGSHGRAGGANKAGAAEGLRLGNIKELRLYGLGRSLGGSQEAIVSPKPRVPR